MRSAQDHRNSIKQFFRYGCLYDWIPITPEDAERNPIMSKLSTEIMESLHLW